MPKKLYTEDDLEKTRIQALVDAYRWARIMNVTKKSISTACEIYEARLRKIQENEWALERAKNLDDPRG